MVLDDLPLTVIPEVASRRPFSFLCGGKPSDDCLDAWPHEQETRPPDAGRTLTTTTWTDPDTGLRVEWHLTRFADFPAAEWILYFENTGEADTRLIESVQALDLTLRAPLSREAPYRLHKTNGAPSNETDFEPHTVAITEKHGEMMGGGGGRPSNKDFPFFKIETGAGSLVVAVGWSGQWQARVSSRGPGTSCAIRSHVRSLALGR